MFMPYVCHKLQKINKQINNPKQKNKNRRKRKIPKALYKKDYRPNLNTQ